LHNGSLILCWSYLSRLFVFKVSGGDRFAGTEPSHRLLHPNPQLRRKGSGSGFGSGPMCRPRRRSLWRRSHHPIRSRPGLSSTLRLLRGTSNSSIRCRPSDSESAASRAHEPSAEEFLLPGRVKQMVTTGAAARGPRTSRQREIERFTDAAHFIHCRLRVAPLGSTLKLSLNSQRSLICSRVLSEIRSWPPV